MFAKVFLYTSLGIWGAGVHIPAFAQSIERPLIHQPQPDVPSFRPQPSDPLILSPPPIMSPADTVEDPLERIQVLRYEIVGSTVFSREELDKATRLIAE